MKQVEAAKRTVELAKSKGMTIDATPAGPGEISLPHLEQMVKTMEDDQTMSESKLGRWLGWIQCAVVAAGVGLGLEDMKEINKTYSGEE